MTAVAAMVVSAGLVAGALFVLVGLTWAYRRVLAWRADRRMYAELRAAAQEWARVP